MGIDPTRTERVEREPDPTRAPLEIVWHINDGGEFVASISFGGVNPFRAADLVASVLDGLIDECRRAEIVIEPLLDTIRWHIHQVGGPMLQIAEYLENRAVEGLQP